MPEASVASGLPQVDVLGVRVTAVDLPGLLGVLDRAVRERRSTTVSFVNPDYLLRAHRDEDLRARMNGFDVMLADGWGVVLAARALGEPLPGRLANDDLGRALFALAEQRGWRVFLFGSAPGTAERAAGTLQREFADLRVVGVLHGWFDALRGHPGRFAPEDDAAVVAAVRAARPDLLLVGLPTPLQQRWVAAHADELQVPVVMSGGSYLDHVAERLDWYPPLVLRARVCWLYRLTREPRRLWRRYTLDLAAYAGLLVRELARRRAAAGPPPTAGRARR